MATRTHTLAISFLVLFSVSRIANSDPPRATPSRLDPSTALEKENALSEILRIRQQLGGSVLKGTVLDTPQKSRSFDTGIRDRLGLPPGGDIPSGSSTVAKLPVSQIVVTLRSRSAELDRIANEIESMREYKNADSLRDTARQLRLIARQFDLPTSGSGAGK